jgi:hypothetical protein
LANALTQIFTGSGLAAATGHRAFVPPLLMGIAHRMAEGGSPPWFQLSEKFLWLADTKVIVILAVLAIVEYLAERNPDAPELVTLALKLPKAVSGFIVSAAAMGQIDDNMIALSASGLLGSATSLGVDTMRAGIKHSIQQPLSDATHGMSDKAMGAAETGWSGAMTWLAWVIPIVVLAGVAVLAFVWLGRKKIENASRVACAKCGFMRHPEAKVCPQCRELV